MQVIRLYREQEELAKKAVFYDAFGKIRRIAGLDCAYTDDRIIGGAVVVDIDTLEPMDKAHSIRKLDFPYIPGLLAYRESEAMIGAFRRLKSDPDILMIDGFGTNHPRRCGLATHVGVKLDMPTIGVGKSFLCGEIRGDDIYQDGKITGRLIRASPNTKPIYVSPGHRVSLKTSASIVSHCMKGHRQPEPTRLAHEYVTQVKNLQDE